MSRVVMDFKGVKYRSELHDVITNSFMASDVGGFPEWWGRNLDALWDVLTGFIYAPVEVVIKNVVGLPKDLQKYMGKVVEVFVDAEKMYGEITVEIIND